MPVISFEEFNNYLLTFKGMDTEYSYVQAHYKELAQYFLPRRYRALDRGKQTDYSKSKNKYLLTSKSTRVARTLAAGMLAGATSPAKQWVQFVVDTPDHEAAVWADAVGEELNKIISETNAHNSLATTYLDLGVFGTSLMLIYEDAENLFRCYTSPAGEYMLMRDARGQISGFSRQLTMTASQIMEQFGEENISDTVKNQAVNQGGSFNSTNGNKLNEYDICHLVEPNVPPTLPDHFAYREIYWEKGQQSKLVSGGQQVLSYAGYYEKPFIAPRWEVVGNDLYGQSPGMEALPDVITLQHLIKNRGEAIDRMNRPALQVSTSLRNQPMSLMPGSITPVPDASSVGARPIYTVVPPIAEMISLANEIKEDIEETFYVDLWKAILNLRTVRSATEVIERSEEKLVLLGPVINRLEDEALTGFVLRVLGIALRNNRIPPAPASVNNLSLKYESILREAQKSIGIQSIERFMQNTGAVAGLQPNTLHVVNWDELVRDYGERLSIPHKLMNSVEQVQQIRNAEQELADAREQAVIGRELTQGAKNLAEASSV